MREITPICKLAAVFLNPRLFKVAKFANVLFLASGESLRTRSIKVTDLAFWTLTIIPLQCPLASFDARRPRQKQSSHPVSSSINFFFWNSLIGNVQIRSWQSQPVNHFLCQQHLRRLQKLLYRLRTVVHLLVLPGFSQSTWGRLLHDRCRQVPASFFQC